MKEMIAEKVTRFQRPKRRAISSRFPVLIKPAVRAKQTLRNIKNIGLTRLKREDNLPFVVARHSSLLYRKLGDSDPVLQIHKVKNLELAIAKLDGLVIPPGGTFSFWQAVGAVTKKKGYKEGMLLSNGKVSVGVGGGLCQLSNFLFWILLHSDVQIVERHHHSVDAFPDSGRTLPFGSGATVFSNYLDLQIKNISKHPLQLHLWLTESVLKGQILSSAPSEKKFHIREENHLFARRGESYFRYNELYRETLVEGMKIHDERIVTNFAPVIYPVTEEYLRVRDYRFFDID